MSLLNEEIECRRKKERKKRRNKGKAKKGKERTYCSLPVLPVDLSSPSLSSSPLFDRRVSKPVLIISKSSSLFHYSFFFFFFSSIFFTFLFPSPSLPCSFFFGGLLPSILCLRLMLACPRCCVAIFDCRRSTNAMIPKKEIHAGTINRTWPHRLPPSITVIIMISTRGTSPAKSTPRSKAP